MNDEGTGSDPLAGHLAGTVPREVREAVARYTVMMCDRWDDSHQVGSGLGVWLLVATLAGAADGELRQRLEEVVGMDGDTAARAAAHLVAAVPHELGAAVAVWAREAVCTDAWHEWARGLDDAVERGDMPDQEGADQWASARTSGLVERFPVAITDGTALVLASALVAKLRWEHPFDLVSSNSLGGTLGSQVARALWAQGWDDPRAMAVVDTEACGRVAVVGTAGSGGHQVVSVAALDTSQPAAAVLRAAVEVASMPDDELAVRQVPWWDLPVGTGGAVDVSDETVRSSAPGNQLALSKVLPAWDAQTVERNLLAERAPGVSDALAVMATMVVDPMGGSAAQSAVARFGKDGFEAAAVTAFGMQSASMWQPEQDHEVTRRTVRFHFGHPHAAVAVAGGAWDGLVVFSAWVAEAAEPE